MHPDQGFTNFKSIREIFSDEKNLSESDTRSKIIDSILKECLGWEESDIIREEHVNSGFIDYTLKLNGVNFLVIEAKKSGLYFDIPKTFAARNYKISASISTLTTLISAMKQARNYCLDIGIKYSIVTNGFQFIIFQAFLIGKKWEDGSCIIFNSFEEIEKNFNHFWNLLSKENVLKGSLINEFENSKRNLNFKKILNELHNPEQKWERNRIFTYLADIVDFVFTELLDEAKTSVLKQCYIYDRSNQSLGKELDNLFIDKLPHFAENYKISDIIESETKAGKFEKIFRELRKTEQELPMVVFLGGIGSGKSTFIHRFFKIIMENRESLQWYYLDFRNSSFNPDSVEDFVYIQIIEQFEKNYNDKIEKQLAEVGFEWNLNDKLSSIKKLFTILKLFRITPVVIVDNVDQHDFVFQEKLFIFTNHLCKSLNIITLLAIREETFIQSTRTGVFDAYLITKFHISSPNFIQMVKTRITFTLKLLNDQKYTSVKKLDNSVVTELVHFFEILNRSFSKDNEQSKKIIYFFDSISVGNMREALRMFNNFLISGNTNIDEMFFKEANNAEDVYQISYHQMLKSIILGEYRFYKSDRSHIANVFDFDTSLTDSHFNQLRILRYLKSMENTSTPIGRGYVSIDELIKVTEDIMIKKEVIIDNLLRMTKFNLIAFDNQSNTDVRSASYIILTASGKLYLEKLTIQFIYLDCVLIDTPITDNSFIRETKQNLNSADLSIRLLRTRNFIRYLIKMENEEMQANPQYLQSSFSNHYFSKDIQNYFNKFVMFMSKSAKINDSKNYFA